jgi:hypothetical protein
LRINWLIVGMKPFTFSSYFTDECLALAEQGPEMHKNPGGLTAPQAQHASAMFKLPVTDRTSGLASSRAYSRALVRGQPTLPATVERATYVR